MAARSPSCQAAPCGSSTLGIDFGQDAGRREGVVAGADPRPAGARHERGCASRASGAACGCRRVGRRAVHPGRLAICGPACRTRTPSPTRRRAATCLAVADGHGSKRHYRSDRGSAFAVSNMMSLLGRAAGELKSRCTRTSSGHAGADSSPAGASASRRTLAFADPGAAGVRRPRRLRLDLRRGRGRTRMLAFPADRRRRCPGVEPRRRGRPCDPARPASRRSPAPTRSASRMRSPARICACSRRRIR